MGLLTPGNIATRIGHPIIILEVPVFEEAALEMLLTRRFAGLMEFWAGT
jgi:hypothetical protein